MKEKMQVIQTSFHDQGIILKEPLIDFKKYAMHESLTNQYMQVEGINGENYLIRINGNLWPPFSRENEQFNLTKLGKSQIKTSVILNNIEAGFQICYWFDPKKNFNKFTSSFSKEEALKKIAKGIMHFHQLKTFKTNYCVASTLDASFASLEQTRQSTLYSYKTILLSMLSTLNFDKKNYVACHNDLLPSSIYFDERKYPIIVDWEYSGTNHRSYDLSLFSIKAALSPKEETILLAQYDKKGQLNLSYSMQLMKPVVNFLLLLWNASSKVPNIHEYNFLYSSLTIEIQRALVKQSEKTILSQIKFWSKAIPSEKNAVNLPSSQAPLPLS